MRQGKRIAAGIALLDEKVPGWCERVDLTTLNLGSTLFCVLGQVFDKSAKRRAKRVAKDMHSHSAYDTAGYWQGLRNLRLSDLSSVALGFDRGHGSYPEDLEETYFNLTRGWKRAIRTHCRKA